MKLKQKSFASPSVRDLLQRPLRMRSDDFSGAPIALIEAARRRNCLDVRDEVEDHEVLIEFPFGLVPQEQTGCSRFVRLRSGRYGLIR
jgi:hypothetical protein